MPTIEDLQKHEHNKPKELERDFKKLKEKVKNISKTIKDYKNKKLKKIGFQRAMRYNLARLMNSAARLGNNADVDITRQFILWNENIKFGKNISTAKGYSKIAETYEGTSKSPETAFMTEGKKLFKILGCVKGKKILDVGCGTGRYSVPLAKKGAEVYGIDISEGMLKAAKRKSKGLNTKYQLSDMRKIPYKDETFDKVISSLAIDHVKDYEKAILEILRVTKKGGKIIISTIHPKALQVKESKNKVTKYGIKFKAFFESDEGRINVTSYARTKKQWRDALKNKAKTIKFFDLKVPKSVYSIEPVAYKTIKNKKMILAMSFIKK